MRSVPVFMQFSFIILREFKMTTINVQDLVNAIPSDRSLIIDELLAVFRKHLSAGVHVTTIWSATHFAIAHFEAEADQISRSDHDD